MQRLAVNRYPLEILRRVDIAADGYYLDYPQPGAEGKEGRPLTKERGKTAGHLKGQESEPGRATLSHFLVG